MCGIVGFMGTGGEKCFKTFVDLLRIDVIRGPHSTGLALLPYGDKPPNIYKDVVLPDELLARDDVRQEMYQSRLGYIGHNRFATKGEINEENAHPFQYDHITGCHNGTVHALYHYPDRAQHKTDSQTILHSISTVGIDKTWEKLDGAAAVVWWNSEEKSYNIIRNDQRPLNFAITKNGYGIFFASESWMLAGCAKRNGVELDQIWSPRPNRLFTFTRDKLNQKIKQEDRDVIPFVRKVISIAGPRNYTINSGAKLTRKEKKALKNPHNTGVKNKPTLFLVDTCDGCREVFHKDDTEMVGNSLLCNDCADLAHTYNITF